MILAVAVVGSRNQPLYFVDVGTNSKESHRLQTLAYCALDGVEEKVPPPGEPAGEWRESFLGVVHATLDNRVYAYVTNTRHVFLLVCDDGPAKEAELRQALAGLHAGFADVAANPFYTPQQPIESRRFDAQARALLQAQGVAAA